MTHRNLEQTCYVENRHHYQTPADNFLCIPPLYHTGAKMHWFGNFIVGAKTDILNGIDFKIQDVTGIGPAILRPGEIATAIIKIIPHRNLTKSEVDAFCNSLAHCRRPCKIIFGDVPAIPPAKSKTRNCASSIPARSKASRSDRSVV